MVGSWVGQHVHMSQPRSRKESQSKQCSRGAGTSKGTVVVVDYALMTVPSEQSAGKHTRTGRALGSCHSLRRKWKSGGSWGRWQLPLAWGAVMPKVGLGTQGGLSGKGLNMRSWDLSGASPCFSFGQEVGSRSVGSLEASQQVTDNWLLTEAPQGVNRGVSSF